FSSGPPVPSAPDHRREGSEYFPDASLQESREDARSDDPDTYVLTADRSGCPHYARRKDPVAVRSESLASDHHRFLAACPVHGRTRLKSRNRPSPGRTP